MSSYENYAAPRARVEATPEELADGGTPALWLPSTTANICLLFPLALGAWLQYRNWLAMGRPDKARAARRWVVADLVFHAACLALPHRLLPLTWLGAFVLLVAWYYASAKPQIAYVKKTYGNRFARRGWLKPLAVGVAAVVLLTLARLATV